MNEEFDLIKLFLDRIEKVKMFSDEDVEKIKKDMILYNKCYLLGILDAKKT